MPLSSDRHIIDEKFREALAEHKVYPVGKIWTRLYSNINEQKKNKITIRRIAFVAVLVFISASGVWTAINEKGKTVSVTEARSILSIPGNNSEDVKSLTLKTAHNTIGSLLSLSKKQPGTFKKDKDPVILSASLSVDKAVPSLVNSSTVSSFPTIDVPGSVGSRNENAIYTDATISDIMATPFFDETQQVAVMPFKNVALTVKRRLSDLSIYRFSSVEKPVHEEQWQPDLKGWYGGFGAALNNTWILDHSAILSNNFTYRATIGTAYSVIAGYNFSNKFGLATAWIILSTQGQKYKYQKINIRTVGDDQKSFSFKYMQVPVVAKFKVPHWSHINQAPVVVNYSIGVQYGRLLSSDINMSQSQGEDNIFRKNEYAIVAGIEYDFISKRSTFFSLGAHASYGSIIYNKAAIPDLGFARPHNMTIGLHAAYNFSLKPKQALTEK
ncbi:MAG: hypothetical protein H0W62_06610 [Chitinophagales bacterium]|nr:hypothetical protein [Chitinophagales bacterium]